ncbi:MAG: hypothetical protein ACLP0J_18500 [Solirubrobacteraceae bacterium]
MEQLRRAARVAAQFGKTGPLNPPSERRNRDGYYDAPSVARADALAKEYLGIVDQMVKEPDKEPWSRERSDRKGALVVHELEPFLTSARAAHQGSLRKLGWALKPAASPSDNNITFVSVDGQTDPSRILLVYGSEPEQQSLAKRVVTDMPRGPLVVVLIEDDPGDDNPTAAAEEHGAVLSAWRAALGADTEARLVMLTLVKLAEDMPVKLAEDMPLKPETNLGRATSDELALARLWLAQHTQMIGDLRPIATPMSQPAWLRNSAGVEERFDSLTNAVLSWLAGRDRFLGAPATAGNDDRSLARAFLEACALSARPQLLYGPSTNRSASIAALVPRDVPAQETERRLLKTGRLIPVGLPSGSLIGTRAVLTDEPTAMPSVQLTLSTLRSSDTPDAIRALADFAEGYDKSQATLLYQEAAERGDAVAMGQMAIRLWRTNQKTAIDWADRLVATGDSDALRAAAANASADQELARRLRAAGADGGDNDGRAPESHDPESRQY